jgi:hypothetical protein
MNREFTPYDRTLKLKELGFDEPCISYYTAYGNFSNDYSAPRKYNSEFELGSYISAPTFQQAFRWFREEHNLHYQLVPFFSDKESHAVDYYLAIAQHRPPIQVKTFEEAELAALDKLIEIVETKQRETGPTEWNGPYAF